MESMRERLQKVADDENRALNILSGPHYTYEMEALIGSGDGMNGSNGKAGMNPGGTYIALYTYLLEKEFLRREAVTQAEELSVYPELQPLIAQCSGPTPAPSASP